MEPYIQNKIKSSALFITILYLVFGILWVVISGEVVLYFSKGFDLNPRMEIYKGYFFILVTSLLLYLVIKRREKHREKLESVISDSEMKYRTLVEASHELIWSTDKDNKITFINNATRNIYGLEPEEMIGKKFTDFATKEQIIEDKKSIIESFQKGENSAKYESRVTDSQGREKVLLTNCIINKNSDDEITGMFGISLDITDRYEAEERIKHNNRVHSLMSNLNQMIVRAKSKEQILNDACRLAVEYGMFQLAWIGIVDENSGNVIPLYYYGDSSNFLSKLNISIYENEAARGPIVRALNENTYFVCNDVETDVELINWRKETLRKGFRSYAVFPIEIKSKVVAVYNIYSEKRNFFGKKETELLLELTEDISFAMEYLELENERHVIEKRYRNIVENAPIGIYVHFGGIISYINPEGCKLLGRKDDNELIGKEIFYLIHPDFREIVLKRLENINSGIAAPELEEKFIKADGNEIDVMVSAIPYTIDGKSGAQVFFRDLTEQKRTKRKIIETNERFELITKASNDALWDWDLKSNEIWWNQAYKDLFGNADEETDKGIDSLLSRININDKERIVNSLNNAIKLKLDFWFDEFSARKKDGLYSYVFGRGNIIKDQNNEPYRMVGSFIDISFSKKMGLELKESEERWRSLFENSPSIIFTMDLNYRITNINRKVSSSLNETEALGKSGLVLFEEPEHTRIKNIIDDVINTNKASSFTAKSALLDEKQYYFSVQAIPRIKNDAVEGLTLIATDITEKMISEDKIKENNASLHALAAHLQTIREEERTMISREIHDQLGQELTALKMDIAFLSKKIEKAKIEPDWDEIHNGLRSMSDITDQTINSVRRIARNLRPDILDKLGLKEAIEWHAEEFTNRTGIDCIVSTSPEEFDFNKDLVTTIFRIVQESLTNVARHSKATRSKIGLKIDGKFIYLTIEDNGKGITEDEIENNKSLGLVGLKERVYSLNGKLSITGQKNLGTKLNIIIPIE